MKQQEKAQRNRRRLKPVVRHRAMEGFMCFAICGKDGVFGHLDQKEFSDFDTSTYDWKKVTCKKCLALRHNY